MPPKRMTANPVKPARYRPGKPVAEEPSSEEEEDDSDQESNAQAQPPPPSSAAAPPKVTSFPSDAAKIANNLKNVNLNERRRIAAAEELARIEEEKAALAKEEEGFVTEESDEDEGDSDEGEESNNEEEESSSEEEIPKVLIRPTFIKKDKRKEDAGVAEIKTEDEVWAEEEARRKAKADELVQEQVEKNDAARAAGKKYWDDDEEGEDQVDDTDGLDPEAERASWKLRELKRVKREREVVEEAEKEREEIERRRNLSTDEREAEDKEFLELQREDREGKGKMGYMQKYYHKGAFFQDDAKAEGLDRRDIMGSRYQDDVTNRELLPQYMQIRDMTKLGRKGRTKYKDLKSEDTGRWGTFEGKGPRKADGTVDERFMPDRDGGRAGGSGANATQVRERKQAPDGAPQGPRASNSDRRRDSPDRADRYVPARDRESDDYRRRPSPRRRSYSRSRSPSRRRGGQRDDPGRRKRSISPDGDRYAVDKRRRVDAA